MGTFVDVQCACHVVDSQESFSRAAEGGSDTPHGPPRLSRDELVAKLQAVEAAKLAALRWDGSLDPRDSDDTAQAAAGSSSDGGPAQAPRPALTDRQLTQQALHVTAALMLRPPAAWREALLRQTCGRSPGVATLILNRHTSM